MFDFIKKIIGSGSEEKSQPVENSEDTHIALCVLLLEAAHVDGTFSLEERDHVVTTLTSQYNIDRSEIDTLLAAGNKSRNESTDLFRFTRYMNNNMSLEEKLTVMEAVWRIILIDDHLEAHEDQFAHKLANLLRLTHKQLIDTKLKARQQLK